MSKIYIEARVLAGTDISEACNGACELAKKLNIDVHFNFNDVICVASPYIDSFQLADKYKRIIYNEDSYQKIALKVAMVPSEIWTFKREDSKKE